MWPPPTARAMSLGAREWWRLGAAEVVEALRAGKVTPSEILRCARKRITEVESGVLNAVPTTCFERAEEKARDLEKRGYPKDPERGYLYGLPVLIKDTLAVKGVRFTRGSRIYENDVADYDDPVVALLERKGAIVVGKTNTPELGLGSNTVSS